MSGSVNKVILIGNLGRDPVTRRLNSGDSVVSFSMATTETWRDKATGERKDRTEWHNVVIFNENLGRIAEQYLKKGSKVYVEGQLQTRKWADKDGVEKYTTEVVLQRFRGELTLMDSRNAGMGEMPRGEEGAAFGGGYGGGNAGFGRTPAIEPRPMSGGGGSSGAGGGRMGETIDDEIPF